MVEGAIVPDLIAQNLTLDSDAVPNYKYMFGPHRDPPTHL